MGPNVVDDGTNGDGDGEGWTARVGGNSGDEPDRGYEPGGRGPGLGGVGG